MLIQIVQFNLQDLSDEEFRTAREQQWAAEVAKQPGLLSKTWLADASTNSYGGIYAWESSAAMERYQESEFFKAFAADPGS